MIIIKLKWLWKLAFQIFIKAYNNMIQYFTGQRPIDVRASLTKMYTTQFKWPHTRILSPCVVYMWLLSHIKKTHHTGWEIFSYKAAVEQITNCLMNFMIRSVICVCITIIFVILSCSLVIDAVNNFEQRQRALRFLLFYWNTMLIFYAGSLAFWLMNNKTLSPDAVQHSLILPAKQTKPSTETPVSKSTTCCESQYKNWQPIPQQNGN